jgi:hypothetical protein
MYDITMEDIFLLFALVVAALIGYVVFLLSGVILDGLQAGLSVFFFLIGARLYVSETKEEKLLGSFVMAAGIGIYVAARYGFYAGVGAFLLSLAGFLAYILLSR